MNGSASQIVRFVIAAFWRRSRLAMILIAIILPLGLGYARFGPKTYATKSLMLLQENNRASPFANDLPIQTNLQGRIVGLQALLKSERVLVSVRSDIEGPNATNDQKEIATWLKLFSANLSLELVGNDFLEFQLLGKSPVGLGRQLQSVTSRFLEALLSSQDATNATQVLVSRKKAELDALVGEYEQLRAAQQADAAALDQQKKVLDAKTQELSAVTVELAKLKGPVIGQNADRPKNSGSGSGETNIAPSSAPVSASPGEIAEAARASPSASIQPNPAPANPAKLKALEGRHAALVAEVAKLERSMEVFRHARQALKSDAPQLREYEAAVQRARESFDEYSRRYMAPVAVRGSTILTSPERIKVIDEPRDPEFPVRSGLRIAVGAFLASLLAACGGVFLAELLDTTMRRESDIEQLTGAPILARLPAGDLEQ